MELSRQALDVERAFIHCDNIYNESPHPVHARYAAVISKLPDASGRSLLAPMYDIYERVMRSDNRYLLDAALNLAFLQNHFVDTLVLNKLLPNHVVETRVADGLYWQYKLHGRRQDVGYPKRSGTRIRKGKVVCKTTPTTWVN